MANENKWEYDYSNIYHRPTTPNAYENVGSSGTNAANQVENSDYFAETPNDGQGKAPHAQDAATPTGAVGGMPPRNQNNAYQASAGSKAHKPSVAKTILLRATALVAVGAVGFAGGYVGSQYGKQDASVMVQQVVRDTSKLETLGTSTAGNDLSFVAASALASPSVVVITTEQMVATSGWYGTQSVESGAGSGVIISADGYILTCAHVVDDAANIVVSLDDLDYNAVLIGSDSETDIAVIKIDATGLTPAVLGDSDALAVGETVMAVGNPLGELGGSVTQGIVSALNRVVVVESYEMTLIQMDASVSPGNSGGGLFNMAGELIGIVNAKSKDSDSEGIGFAIPVNTAFELAQSLIENGYITGRPELGIVALNINDAEMAYSYGVNAYGIYVYSINEGSAAEKAGLQVGDRLVSIEDTEISELDDLTNVIETCTVGDTVNLLVARKGQMLSVPVTLGEKGAPAATKPESTMAQDDLQLPQGEEGTLPDATQPGQDATMPERDNGQNQNEGFGGWFQLPENLG